MVCIVFEAAFIAAAMLHAQAIGLAVPAAPTAPAIEAPTPNTPNAMVKPLLHLYFLYSLFVAVYFFHTAFKPSFCNFGICKRKALYLE